MLKRSLDALLPQNMSIGDKAAAISLGGLQPSEDEDAAAGKMEMSGVTCCKDRPAVILKQLQDSVDELSGF